MENILIIINNKMKEKDKIELAKIYIEAVKSDPKIKDKLRLELEKRIEFIF